MMFLSAINSNMKYLSLLLVGVMFSCSSVELIPGLCYNDKDGTYLCPSECDRFENPIDNFCIEPEYLLDPPMDRPDLDCEIWREHSDPEAYMNCILIA